MKVEIKVSKIVETYIEDTTKDVSVKGAFFLAKRPSFTVLEDPMKKGSFLQVKPVKSRIIEDPKNKGHFLEVIGGVTTIADPMIKGRFYKAEEDDYLCDYLVEPESEEERVN